MEINNRLREIRTEAGLSQAELAQRLSKYGFSISSLSTISKWERRATDPSFEQVLAICEICGHPEVRYAFFNENVLSGTQFDRLNFAGKQQFYDYLNYLFSKPKYTEKVTEDSKSKSTIRLYDMPASAGVGQDFIGEDYTEMEVDDTIPSEADFAVRLRGNSMEPRFLDGQIVFIAQTHTLNVGDIGIVSLNDCAYCKRITDEGLESINSEYKPIPIGALDSLYVFGKVIG